MNKPLTIETISVNQLKPDPENARKHSKRNIDVIKKSLETFGQRKPLVVFGDNYVMAGNGTLESAKQLGWKEITISRVPIDWTAEQARAYALADNRSAELAEWDAEILATQILEMDAIGFDITEFGFADNLLKENDGSDGDGDPALGETTFKIIIECRDELHQAELMEELASKGLNIRPLMM